MAAVRATISLPSTAFAVGPARRQSARWPFRTAISAFSSGGDNTPLVSLLQGQLVIYTKPGCCLCEGLQEKLQAALSHGGPRSLHSVKLQVRDISKDAEWERLYQYDIPVLAKLLPDGSEEILPRLSPRLGVELIQKKIAAAFKP